MMNTDRLFLKVIFMIFSSNRPNGKGGFDLYIVEIDFNK